VLCETGAGASCTTLEEIAAQLRAWYEEWERTATVVCRSNMDELAKYSRRDQAGQLAALQDEITS